MCYAYSTAHAAKPFSNMTFDVTRREVVLYSSRVAEQETHGRQPSCRAKTHHDFLYRSRRSMERVHDVHYGIDNERIPAYLAVVIGASFRCFCARLDSDGAIGLQRFFFFFLAGD